MVNIFTVRSFKGQRYRSVHRKLSNGMALLGLHFCKCFPKLIWHMRYKDIHGYSRFALIEKVLVYLNLEIIPRFRNVREQTYAMWYFIPYRSSIIRAFAQSGLPVLKHVHDDENQRGGKDLLFLHYVITIKEHQITQFSKAISLLTKLIMKI